MTGEHLLEAMGLLDDDLIQDAERPQPRRLNWRQWMAVAACVAIVATVGYRGLSNFGMGGNAGGASGNYGENDTASGGTTAGVPDAAAPLEPGVSGGGWEGEKQEGATGDGSPSLQEEVLTVVVPAGERVYSYCHRYGEDRVLEELPEGCRALGAVEPWSGEENAPYTDFGDFEGCALWLAGEGYEGPLYLELPEGGYLECAQS